MKVLLVEDDELVRTTLVDMLIDAGFEVTEAGSPEEALGEDDAAEPPNVLVTDIDLGSSLNALMLLPPLTASGQQYRSSTSAGCRSPTKDENSAHGMAISRNPSPATVC